MHSSNNGLKTILFVDDERELADLGSCMLEKLGYSVVTETNPVQALETVKNRAGGFDAVITDMTMPGMSGDRLAEALKKIHPEIPVILCTGLGSSEIAEKTAGTVIDAVLKKPVELKEFSETVSRILP